MLFYYYLIYLEMEIYLFVEEDQNYFSGRMNNIILISKIKDIVT